MTSTIAILAVWFFAVCGVLATMCVVTNVCFWVFAKAFGVFDSYMQDRYWEKRGFLKTMSQDGEEWYVGWDKE
jgi:hypothetical protein